MIANYKKTLIVYYFNLNQVWVPTPYTDSHFENTPADKNKTLINF